MKNTIATILIFVLLSPIARGADWPMYRADAARSGYTTESLPDKLTLLWTYRGRANPTPAWPTSSRMHFDRAWQPIVAGGCVIFGTSADDKVIALSLDTGSPKWTFFTEGPVRFAPVVWKDRLFAASDDGWIYALSLADGTLLWKRRGGPNNRKCMGNGRLISRWPARGGPVVLKDTVYFAAGIWPSDGIYLHALDARTGKSVWTNDRTGRLQTPQPHSGATAKSGPAPQGYLMASDRHIFAPTGRAVPAAFNRSNGKLDYYHLQKNQSIGGSRAILADRFFLVAGCLFEQKGGDLSARCGRGVLSATPRGVVQSTGDLLVAYRWKDLQAHDRRGKAITYRGLEESARISLRDESKTHMQLEKVVGKLSQLKPLYDVRMRFKAASDGVARQRNLETGLSQSRPVVERMGARVNPFLATTYERTNEVIVAGDEPVCGSSRRVDVVDLKTGKSRWSHPVQGAALGLAVASGRLIVSTDRGVLYCFGRQTGGASKKAPKQLNTASRKSRYEAAASEIVKTTGLTEGFCVDLGCGSGELSLALARRTKLRIYAVESDPVKVASARKMLDAAGLYGVRVTVHQADPSDPPYPAYFANLIVSARSVTGDDSFGANRRIRRMQRPDGGVICTGKPGRMKSRVRGPLDGAGSWTHQNANPANTICSKDRILRGPLTMLWYRDTVLKLSDRHGQGPAPLVHRGCLVTEGLNGICAVDAYNGRTLWVYDLPGILKDYDGVHHDVGVGDTGSNFCLSDDSVYVVTGPRCLRIDLVGGKKLGEMQTPVAAEARDRAWGYVACSGGTLFGTVANHEHAVSPRYLNIKLRTESVLFFALDAKTGKLKWRYKPKNSIRHNTIAIGAKCVYLIDRPIALADRITKPQPRGKHRPPLKPGKHPAGVLVCLDAATGRVLWKQSDDVFGTQLALSEDHGVVLMHYQAVKHSFFKLPSEIGGRLAAFDAASGRRLWDIKASFVTRPVINGEVIYAEGGAWNVKTGKPTPFEFKRSYGCGQISASTNLMLFRSGTLGYLDLTRSVGTENFGGIRPGCWFNAIPAGGLVLVPDGSSNCACSYQMHAWLALQPAE